MLPTFHPFARIVAIRCLAQSSTELSFSCGGTFQLLRAAAVDFAVVAHEFVDLSTAFLFKAAAPLSQPARVFDCNLQVLNQTRDCATFRTRKLCAVGLEQRSAFCSALQSNKFLHRVVSVRTCSLKFPGRLFLRRDWLLLHCL